MTAVVLLAVTFSLVGTGAAQLEKVRDLEAGESLQIGEMLVTMHQKLAGSPNSEGWYPALSKGGGFRVAVPSPYNDMTVSAPTEDGARADTHSILASTIEGARLIAMCLQRSDEKVEPGWVADVAESIGARVKQINTSPVTRDGMRGLTIRAENEVNILLGQILAGSKKVCQLTVQYPATEEEYMLEFAELFFASFAPHG